MPKPNVIEIPHNWRPRPYQKPLWDALNGGIKRAVCVWHRRAGKDSVGLNWTIKMALCPPPIGRVGLYWHIFPTAVLARETIWYGSTLEGRRFIDMWPKELVLGQPRKDEMRIELVSGSVWHLIGSDEPDRLRGPNPIGCIFSEYSCQDPQAWDVIRPILAENGGWALFLYTPQGHNHGYDLLRMAQKNDNWFAQVLTVDDTKSISDKRIQEDRDSGYSEQQIQQEYYCSFEAALIGAYYADQMDDALSDGRIRSVPWNPKLPVHTWWDLGVGDPMSIWFVQIDNDEIRLIDYYESTGKGFTYYIKMMREKPYVYGFHVSPFDIENPEMGTGMTRFDTAAGLGLKFIVAPKLKVDEGIEAVRQILPRCLFDEEKCQYGIDALRSYRKEEDKTKGGENLTFYKNRPYHDWASHAADAFRYGALMIDNLEKRKRTIRPSQASTDYSVFG